MLSAASGDESELYDAGGKLISITSRTGLVQVLTYSDGSTPPTVAPRAGLLIRVSDPFGRQLNFTYDGKSHVNTITDPAGVSMFWNTTGQPAAAPRRQAESVVGRST